MLLTANERPALRTSRRWSVAVASLTLGLTVVMSGTGFAQPGDLHAITAAVPAPPPAEAVILPQLDPINPGVAARGTQLVIPVIGVAPFHALPVRHAAGLPIPMAAQAVPLLAPLPDPITGIVQPPVFEFVDPSFLQMRDQITLLRIELERAQLANVDEKDDRVKAIKAEIEKLTKDLEKLQKDQPRANPGGNRVVGGGQPVPGGLEARVQVAPLQGGFGGSVIEPRLGVVVDCVSPVLADQLDLPKGQGVVLSGVLKEQAADKAGLKPNDIVLEFAGRTVADNPGEFLKAVSAVKVGDKVDLVVLRKGKKETIKGLEVPEAKRNAQVVPIDPLTPFPARPLNIIPPVPTQPLLPATPARPLVVPVPARPALIPAPGGPGQRSIQVQIDNDSFSIQANEDGTQYSIRGTAKDGKPEVSRIQITDGGVVLDVASLDKVPEKHKERVKQLLDGVKFGK